jgi:RNA polymerase sigma factor (sigma-70 family)
MVGGQLDSLIHYLRQVSGGDRTGDQTDAQLLDRFLKAHEATAFEAILGRHGALVWSVCRAILHDSHDAEDAFQATFLVLVRQARSIRKHTSLRSWLHGVAYRIAVQAEVNARKRRTHERQGVDMEAVQPLGSTAGADLGPALHEELSRLPEKYRLPLLLCYLEQRTYEEAARELGWPLGTLKKRLSDGRELLRKRLLRHGLTLSAGALGTVLAASAATAAVPVTLLKSTLQAALLVAAGKAAAGAVAAPIAALTEGAVHAMFVNKMKVVFAGVLILALLGAGGTEAYQKLAAARAAEPGAGAQPARDNEQARTPDAMYTIIKAQLYEVDDAFHTRLQKVKRLPVEELERRFLAGNGPGGGDLFKLLDSQKLQQLEIGKAFRLNDGQAAMLLSRRQKVRCLPSPEQVRKGDKAPQQVQEGESLRAQTYISADRRFVRVKLTEKATEIEEIKKVKVPLGGDQEADADIPFLKETAQSRDVEIPDGGTFLMPAAYRPQAARAKDRWWVVRIDVRIYIEAEEREIRRQQARQPPWGQAVEGVQCRLRADKTVWQAGQTPSLKAEVRNQGKRQFFLAQAQQLCELEIDGQTHRWMGEIDVKSSAFGPGRHYEGIVVSLVKEWQGAKNRRPIQLAPGAHKVRVVFLPVEAAPQGQELRVVSNPVQIEMRAAK